MSVINAVPLLAAAGGGYQISRSVRARASATAYFNRTPASTSNRKTWTWSGWVKRGSLGGSMSLFGTTGSSTDTTFLWFGFNSSDKFTLSLATAVIKTSTQVFRDPSAWYHVVVSFDTTQATGSNRIRFFVNGQQITVFDVDTAPTQNIDHGINLAQAHFISTYNGTNYTLDGYLTEVNFIDGQALTPSSFGETDAVTGVWKPKKYAGTYGTNGFYLNFSDNSAATAAAIGKDYSGNGNNWTPNNISVTAGVTYDSMLDVPTPYADGGNGRGNYAVWNPLSKAGSNITISDGNLKITKATSTTQEVSFSTVGVASGAFYWEMKPTAFTWVQIGVNSGIDGAGGSGRKPNNILGWTASSGIVNNAGTTLNATTYAANDVLGFALDATSDTLALYKNNTLIYTVTSLRSAMGLSAGSDVFAFIANDAASNSATVEINFGQRPFAYTPPTGFKAMNTQNLPDSTIKKGNQYFDVSTWTGDGGSTKTISGLNFQPDLVWTKQRSIAQSHEIWDAVRGTGKSLESNSTAAEYTGTTYGQLSSFNSDGFTGSKGTDPTYSFLNANGGTYVGWQWKKGATQGFDIVTYTGTGVNGQTVAHNLGVTPSMWIIKKRANNSATNTGNWIVVHKSIAATGSLANSSTITLTNYNGAILLNSTGASVNYTYDNQIGGNTDTFVAYLFSEVAGFSKFGSVSMNGSADGAFVFTGFLPNLVMLKRTDSISNWIMWDTVRNTYNVVGEELYPNLSNAASTVTDLDILSNGFKMRNSGFSGTWIYAAWAQSPFKNSLAR